jgi:hypothetical protein
MDHPEKKVVELYLRVKKIMIIAEETAEEDFKTFLQPHFELNRAFDHLNRVKAAEFKLTEDTIPTIEKYIEDNYSKAIGHLYRAFFDVTDWLSMKIRKSITDTLQGYSNECINTVVPNYYSNIKPKIYQISNDIASIRNQKDIGNLGTRGLMAKYEKIIYELNDEANKIKSATGALEEYAKREKKEKSWNEIYDIKKIILAALITLLLGIIIGKFI